MLTFSLNSNNDYYSQVVWEAVNKNIRYFKKFNGNRWEEAAQKTFLAALSNRDDTYDDIEPYIKKLARKILRVESRESPYDLYNESGEVSYVYRSLVESIDDCSFEDTKEITDLFKELYLVNETEFLKMKGIFVYDDVVDIPSLKEVTVKNEHIRAKFSRVMSKYGGDIVFKTLYVFFKDLEQLTCSRGPEKIRVITLKEGNSDIIAKIPDVPWVRTESGELVIIDKETLTMKVNPDYVKWDTAYNTSCDIMKIDISPVINYMYEEVYVEEGVSTRHISWCGDKYKLVSPGGRVVICEDRGKFMSSVYSELILNILMNNMHTIIALSPDYVYIKPPRAMQETILRVKFVTGKLIDLPITVHIRKRRKVQQM